MITHNKSGTLGRWVARSESLLDAQGLPLWILARLAGGALLVAGANQLHRAELAEAIGALEAVGARALGIVLNHLPRKQTDTYAYYGPDSDRPGRRKTSQPRRGAAHSSRQRRSGRATTRATGPIGSTGPTAGGRELDDLLGPERPAAPPARWPGDPIG